MRYYKIWNQNLASMSIFIGIRIVHVQYKILPHVTQFEK
jgi:hypothetical protein